jgi:hypothetical protein
VQDFAHDDKPLPTMESLAAERDKAKRAEFIPKHRRQQAKADDDEDVEDEDADQFEDMGMGMDDDEENAAGEEEADEDEMQVEDEEEDDEEEQDDVEEEEEQEEDEEEEDADDESDKSIDDLKSWEVAALPLADQLRYFGVASESAYQKLDRREKSKIDKKLLKLQRIAARRSQKEATKKKQEQAADDSAKGKGKGGKGKGKGKKQSGDDEDGPDVIRDVTGSKRQTLLFSATLSLASNGRRSAEQQARWLKRMQRLGPTKARKLTKTESVLGM